MFCGTFGGRTALKLERSWSHGRAVQQPSILRSSTKPARRFYRDDCCSDTWDIVGRINRTCHAKLKKMQVRAKPIHGRRCAFVVEHEHTIPKCFSKLSWLVSSRRCSRFSSCMFHRNRALHLHPSTPIAYYIARELRARIHCKTLDVPMVAGTSSHDFIVQ